MEKPSKFYHSHHACQRQLQRKIDAATMERVILDPDTVKRCGKGIKGGNRYIFYAMIDGRSLAVLAECKANECWVITGYEK